MEATIESVNSLGWTLLQDMPPGSKTISPVSLAVAVAMLAGGASASKRTALCAKLGVDTFSSLSTVMSDMLSSLPLATANAAFIDSSVKLKQPYAAYLASFNANITQFRTLAESVDDINAWISETTHGLIGNMLSARELRNTHIVLVNTVAFKGTWAAAFNPRNTIDWPFGPTHKHVPMMFLHDTTVRTLQTKAFTAVQLPYASGSFVAFLPAGEVVLADIKGVMLADSRFKPRRYDKLGLPKFELESDLSTLQALQDAGYPLPGNYPEMGNGPNIVENVLHRALVKVDEEGTTAAAATVVKMTRGRPIEQQTLVFDRPFAFAIMDERSLVLFSGVCDM